MTKKDVVDFGTTVYLALIAVIVVCILILSQMDNAPNPAPAAQPYQQQQAARVEKWGGHDADDAEHRAFFKQAVQSFMHQK